MAKDKKDELYERIAGMVVELEIPYYSTLLLVNMIYRKVKHPLEKTDKIVEYVTSKVLSEEYRKYKGKLPMKISKKRELENLEEVLHSSKKLPEEDLTRGYIVSNVVKYYAKKVLED